MNHSGRFRAIWPQQILLACIACVLLARCDSPGPSMVTSPEGKPSSDGAKPPPPAPADPAIAFYIKDGGNGPWSLKVMNADGSNVTAIFSTPYTSVMQPSWSPNGGSLAFSQDRGPGNPGDDLMAIDVTLVSGVPTGTNLRVLLDRTSNLEQPAWSPAGDQVAFVDLDARTLEVIPAAGGAASVVYTSVHTPHYPAWNRDGTQIAFSEFDDAGATQVIRMVEVATGIVTTLLDADQARLINPTGELLEALDWARTQDKLAFNTGFNPRRIYTLAIPGGTPVFVVEGRGPTWSPNDAEIVFEGRKLSRVNVATGAVTQFGASGMFPDRRRF